MVETRFIASKGWKVSCCISGFSRDESRLHVVNVLIKTEGNNWLHSSRRGDTPVAQRSQSIHKYLFEL